MTAQYSYEESARLAGEIFGKIFDRAADHEGYQYVLDCIQSGRKSIRQLIIDFVSSDEFIERFLAGRPPLQTAKLVSRLLLGRPLPEQDAMAARNWLIRSGLREFARRTVSTAEYMRKVGPDRVPPFGHEYASNLDSDVEWSEGEE